MIERSLHKRRDSAAVDRIPLGDDYINCSTDVCYAVMVNP